MSFGFLHVKTPGVLVFNLERVLTVCPVQLATQRVTVSEYRKEPGHEISDVSDRTPWRKHPKSGG